MATEIIQANHEVEGIELYHATYHIFDSETECLRTASNMDVVLDSMISEWRTVTCSQCSFFDWWTVGLIGHSTFSDIVRHIHHAAVMTYHPETKQRIHQTRYVRSISGYGCIILQVQKQTKSLKTLALETLMKTSPGLFDRSKEDLKDIGFPHEVAQMIVEQKRWENAKVIHYLF